MTPEQFEAFYTAHYPRLVKFLVFLHATVEEAEDAVQKAMADLFRHSRTAGSPDRPDVWVRKAAVNFFIKERERDRERLPREVRGGHLVIDAPVDDQMTDWEDGQWVERRLERLTPTQRRVIELVMEGLSTSDIAEKLGKTDQNIRQHRKNAKDRLKSDPEIAALAPGQSMNPAQHEAGPTGTTPEPRKEEVQ